jgi:ribonuclease HI
MGSGTGAQDRKLVFCPTIEDWSIPELVQECPHCHAFLLYCCACQSQDRPLPCHHFRIVFTDGACTNNGRPEARAGAGVAYTSTHCPGGHFEVPITNSEDNSTLRSNQRAELLAAKLGLEILDMAAKLNSDESSGVPGDGSAWIIATDSEYVVKGMTEWLPAWKVCPNCVRKIFKTPLMNVSRGIIGVPPKVPAR